MWLLCGCGMVAGRAQVAATMKKESSISICYEYTVDLESSGLSIRVQVPSLAPEFARASPAWLWDVLVFGPGSAQCLSWPDRGKRSCPCIPAAPLAAAPLSRSWTIPPYPSWGRPVPGGIARPAFLTGPQRAIPRQAVARLHPSPCPVPAVLHPPSPLFRQRNVFHLDRHASILIFGSRELPGDRRPAA